MNCLDCEDCVVSEHCTGNSIGHGGLYDCKRDGHIILRPQQDHCNTTHATHSSTWVSSNTAKEKER